MMTNSKQMNKLMALAKDDPVIYQLLAAYQQNAFKSYEDFLFNAVLVLAEIKNALHGRLEEHLLRADPPTIVINTDTAKRILGHKEG